MKKVLFLLCLLSASVLLNACQTTDLGLENEVVSQVPLKRNPVDVISDFVAPQAIAPQAVSVAQGNLFSNGGFESGLDGWSGCTADAISIFSSVENAYEGNNTLKVNAGKCFYRSAEVSAGKDLVLSCYARIENGTGWTGMGMGFSNSNWVKVADAPTTIITSNNYVRYEVRATTPANTKYASMWLYSDNLALIDNCSLELESVAPPPPPAGRNLIENPKINGLGSWSLGCARDVSGIAVIGIRLKNGTCLDQSLSGTDIATLQGQDFTFLCNVQNTGGYAAMTVFFDGQPSSVIIPGGNFSGIEAVQIRGTVGNNVSSGFVSLYAEGDSLFIGECSLSVDTGEPPPPPLGENLLENSNFQQLDTWNIGCSGSVNQIAGRRPNREARFSLGYNLKDGACVDQTLSPEDLAQLAGKNYTYSCYTKNVSGYASLSIFFDGVPVSKVVPTSSDFELVEITGIAPTASSGFVSIYANGNLVVDDCVLAVSE